MSRVKALELLKKYFNIPIFNVKTGVCSPQVENVTLKSALEEMDRCSKFTTEFWEYVYIYPSSFVKEGHDIERALILFNLGRGREGLNNTNHT